MANELLIKINADAKNAEKAFDDIRAKTEDLEGTLGKVALVSAAAFAALTAEVFFSVKAFEEAEAASAQLSNALQNQGIFTEELVDQYKSYADAVQAATGIDNDAIIKAQAVAQSFLGQTKITEDLSFAIADLAAKTGGDLNSAAERIARTIGTSTNAFAKQGLVISETATESERYAKVLEFVQAQAGGLAAEFNKANGYTQALATAFGNFQEQIGARFAPVLASARLIAIGFFDAFTKYPFIADLAVALIAAGAAVSGIIALLAAAVPAFLALSAAVTAVGLSFSIAFVGIPLLIGAVITAVTLLALNWDKSMAAIQAATTAAITVISELFSGLGKILSGALDLNPSRITAGLTQIKESFGKAKDAAVLTYTEITAAQAEEGEKQDAKKKEIADRIAATERAHQANLRAIRQAEIDLFLLQNNNASAEIIALKQKEVETLKALGQERSAAEIAVLRERQALIASLQEEQQAQDLEKQIAFQEIMSAAKAEFQANDIANDTTLRADKLAQIQATAETELSTERNLQAQILSTRIAARNQEMLDRKKFGVTYATINKTLNSDEVKGAASAASELVQLQQSKNATLKTIGKVAAVADITVKTAQSAMNIYAGFSTIPIIGPALGIAGAAAAVLFGAERISAVTSAQDGGLITGGVPGRDSVPALLEPGELVVPRRNFNDVVGAVSGEGASTNGPEILAALQSIDQKISSPQTTIIQGDVTTDDSYIDALVRRISDAVEFRNAQIFGVTT